MEVATIGAFGPCAAAPRQSPPRSLYERQEGSVARSPCQVRSYNATGFIGAPRRTSKGQQPLVLDFGHEKEEGCLSTVLRRKAKPDLGVSSHKTRSPGGAAC